MTRWQIVYSTGDATWSHFLLGTYIEANQHAQAECQRFPGARFYISEEFKPGSPARHKVRWQNGSTRQRNARKVGKRDVLR